MKTGSRVEVIDKDHFRFGHIGHIMNMPDKEVPVIEFQNLGRDCRCLEWVHVSKLKELHDDKSGGAESEDRPKVAEGT